MFWAQNTAVGRRLGQSGRGGDGDWGGGGGRGAGGAAPGDGFLGGPVPRGTAPLQQPGARTTLIHELAAVERACPVPSLPLSRLSRLRVPTGARARVCNFDQQTELAMDWLLQQAHIASSPAMSGAGQSPGAEESFMPDQDVRTVRFLLIGFHYTGQLLTFAMPIGCRRSRC